MPSRKPGRISSSPEYSAWGNMIQRCLNPAHPSFKDYGGRGITVCDRWRKSANFLADMGPRPTHKHTIERLDNDGSYCPENCEWRPRSDQLENQRRTVRITFNGETHSLNRWAKQLGLNAHSLEKRLANLPLDRAMNPKRISNHERKSIRLLTAKGETKPLAVWARELGISHTSIIERIRRGWTIERAVTTKALK